MLRLLPFRAQFWLAMQGDGRKGRSSWAATTGTRLKDHLTHTAPLRRAVPSDDAIDVNAIIHVIQTTCLAACPETKKLTFAACLDFYTLPKHTAKLNSLSNADILRLLEAIFSADFWVAFIDQNPDTPKKAAPSGIESCRKISRQMKQDVQGAVDEAIKLAMDDANKVPPGFVGDVKAISAAACKSDHSCLFCCLESMLYENVTLNVTLNAL